MITEMAATAWWNIVLLAGDADVEKISPAISFSLSLNQHAGLQIFSQPQDQIQLLQGLDHMKHIPGC